MAGIAMAVCRCTLPCMCMRVRLAICKGAPRLNGGSVVLQYMRVVSSWNTRGSKPGSAGGCATLTIIWKYLIKPSIRAE